MLHQSPYNFETALGAGRRSAQVGLGAGLPTSPYPPIDVCYAAPVSFLARKTQPATDAKARGTGLWPTRRPGPNVSWHTVQVEIAEPHRPLKARSRTVSHAEHKAPSVVAGRRRR